MPLKNKKIIEIVLLNYYEMQKTEENIFLLLKIVEDFNNKCTFYKSKNKTNSMCSNTVSTKDSSNEDDRKEFLETFNDFIRKLNNLHHHLLEDNDMNETYQNVDKTYNTNKNINCIDRSDTENCMEGNLNSDENMKERCKGKMKENEKISEEKEKNVCIDKKKTKLLNNFYNNDLSKSNRNINLQIYKEFHHTDSKSEYSLTDTNTSIENEDIINKRNDILIKYVIDLDYALNVKRISKENLIEEIKEFYTIHNNNIRLNNYSMYLSVEVINILKKKIDKDNFHFINKHENPFKNNKFFFNVPSNYLFIKNYSEQNKEILYASNNTNYEKSLNGISTYALSYNSSSVNGNSCNLCANSILSRNNSYNKYNSPNFGFLERQFSPNFGSFDENNNSENFNNKDENEFHKSSDYEEDKCNIYFNYNSHKEPTDKVLSKCSTALSSKNMNIYNSPDYSSNYNNEEELTNNLNDKTELDNDQLYEINNIENKKNNLSSNTSDFYQSISNFYKNKENYNCGEIDHTYIQKSSLFTNSNETDININNKSFHENKKNLINLCFDDELSSAITLNNDSSLNKDKSSCYLSEKGNYISDYKTDSNNKYIYEEENKLHMEKLMEYEQDENRWYDEYCNGDPSLFRSKQLKKKKEIMLHYLSSLSDNNSIKENLKKSTKYEIGNINPNKDDRNFNSGNNYDNMYNVINLKVMYENNKSEFCTNEEIIFFPNQIIVNKYQVLKIISKTKFSTTLKCLNLHYKKKKNNKKMHSIKNNENDEEPIYRNIDENWNKNICNPLNCLKSERKTVSSNEYNKKKNYDSENVQRSNNNSNNNNRKKDYKYVCLKVMNNGKSFLDQGLFELIVLNMLCNENNNVNDNSNNKLTNKNIIQLYDYFYFKEHLIIVTEYMQSDLYNYFIKKGKIGTIGQLQVLAKNLLEGLEFIHSKNLIHCDLKPENIMISMKKRDYGKRQKKKNGNKSINEEVVNCYNLKNLKTLNITKNDFLEHDSHIDNANQDEFISSLHKNNEDNMDNFSINNYTEHNKLKNNLDIPHMYSKKANNDLFSCGENSTNSEDLQIFSGEKFDKIKIIDFNSAIYESDKLKMYVQTRSYRSPEVLLQQNYDRKIDIWSLGCILFEFLTKKILFDHQNIYRFIYSIVSYIGHLPFYMIYECKIPYIFTKHGLIILKKIILDKNFENCVKEKPIDEMDDQEVIFNSKDFFRLNKKMDLEDELIQTKQQNTDASSKQRSQEVYYDVCYPNNNLLKNNFHIGDLLFIDFLLSLLQIDPCKRLDSTQALKHPWLTPNLYKDGL